LFCSYPVTMPRAAWAGAVFVGWGGGNPAKNGPPEAEIPGAPGGPQGAGGGHGVFRGAPRPLGAFYCGKKNRR